MATPLRGDWVMLGGLLLGSAGIDVVDYDGLLGDAPMRFTDRPIPGVPGVDPGPMQPNGLRATIRILLRGDSTQDGESVTGMSERIEQFYDHLAAVRAVTRNNTIQSLVVQLYPGMQLEGLARIIDGDMPHRDGNPWAAFLIPDLVVHEGPLEFPGGEGEGE